MSNTTTPFADLVAGQTSAIFDAVLPVIGNIKAKRLRLLAISGKTRHPLLIKSARQELRLINRADIEATISLLVGCPVIRSYYDMDVEAAEQVEVYVLETDIEKRLLRQDLDRLGGIGKK